MVLYAVARSENLFFVGPLVKYALSKVCNDVYISGDISLVWEITDCVHLRLGKLDFCVELLLALFLYYNHDYMFLFSGELYYCTISSFFCYLFTGICTVTLNKSSS